MKHCHNPSSEPASHNARAADIRRRSANGALFLPPSYRDPGIAPGASDQEPAVLVFNLLRSNTPLSMKQPAIHQLRKVLIFLTIGYQRMFFSPHDNPFQRDFSPPHSPPYSFFTLKHGDMP